MAARSLTMGMWSAGLIVVAASTAAGPLDGLLTLSIDPRTAAERPLRSTAEWRDVLVSAGRCTTDIAAESDERYTLLVANLGPGGRHQSVGLRLTCADSNAAAEPVSWKPVAADKHHGSSLDAAPVAVDNAAPVSALLVQNQVARRESTFWLPALADPSSVPAPVEPAPCRLLCRGHRFAIWHPADEACDTRVEHWADRVGQLLERQVLPVVEAHLGSWPDIDGDDCLSVVVTDRVSLVAPDLQAFVRRRDFEQSRNPLQPAPSDVIYLRTGAALPSLPPILAHELTHVAQFSWCHALAAGQPWGIPDWLTEGFAHAAEVATTRQWSNLADRMATFAWGPHEHPLVLDHPIGVADERAAGHRGAAAAFGMWWVAENHCWDWPAVLQAFQFADCPWTALRGEPFAEVYRQWSLHTCCRGIPTRGGSRPVQTLPLHCNDRLEVSIASTATAYIELRLPKAGRYQLQWDADHAEALQVTLVRQSADR